MLSISLGLKSVLTLRLTTRPKTYAAIKSALSKLTNADVYKRQALFTIYKDYACTNKYKEIKVKAVGTSTKITIKDIAPGTYYMKETGRCYGAIKNKKIYKFKITQGKKTTKLSVLKDGVNEVDSTTSSIKNVPFIFTGNLFAKYKTNTAVSYTHLK